MRFCDPHRLLLYSVCITMGLVVYFMIIAFVCSFLAFGEESDNILNQMESGRAGNRGPEMNSDQLLASVET